VCFATHRFYFGDQPRVFLATAARETDGKTTRGETLGDGRAYIVAGADNEADRLLAHLREVL
jgi:hypothetical protein